MIDREDLEMGIELAEEHVERLKEELASNYVPPEIKRTARNNIESVERWIKQAKEQLKEL